MTTPPFAQLCAIVQDCWRVHPNVTDCKDVARTVLAKRRLAVDVATLDRALAAVLAQQPPPVHVPTGGPVMVLDEMAPFDYEQVARTLRASGLLPAPSTTPSTKGSRRCRSSARSPSLSPPSSSTA